MSEKMILFMAFLLLLFTLFTVLGLVECAWKWWSRSDDYDR